MEMIVKWYIKIKIKPSNAFIYTYVYKEHCPLSKSLFQTVISNRD